MANICLVYRLVWDWYYLKSLPACTGIKLIPDLGHTRLVWYLIPVLIPVSDPIYQTNTCLNLCKVLKNITRNWDCICTVRICTSYNYLNGWSQIAKMFPNNVSWLFEGFELSSIQLTVVICYWENIWKGYKLLSFESSWSVCEMKKLWALKIEVFIVNCFKTFTSKF
jgi:hypothetical protein